MSYYLSVKEAADYLGVDIGLVRGLLNRAWLPGEKVERVWRIPAEAVEAFYASVTPRGEWRSDSRGELVLAHNERCPVCAGAFHPMTSGSSSFSKEFLECQDCGLSLHESLLQHEANLSEHVQAHGKSLLQKEKEGQRARALLQRRQSALRKVEALLSEV